MNGARDGVSEREALLDSDQVEQLMYGVQVMVDGCVEYRPHGSRWSDEDGRSLESTEIVWLCRVGVAAVAFRCSRGESRRSALRRLVSTVDELALVRVFAGRDEPTYGLDEAARIELVKRGLDDIVDENRSSSWWEDVWCDHRDRRGDQVGALDDLVRYVPSGSRWSDGDGETLESVDVVWLCRVAVAAVELRCAVYEERPETSVAVARLATHVDELPVVLEMRDV